MVEQWDHSCQLHPSANEVLHRFPLCCQAWCKLGWGFSSFNVQVGCLTISEDIFSSLSVAGKVWCLSVSKIPSPAYVVLGFFGHEGHVLYWLSADFWEQCFHALSGVMLYSLLNSCPLKEAFGWLYWTGLKCGLCFVYLHLFLEGITSWNLILCWNHKEKNAGTQTLLPWIHVIPHARAAEKSNCKSAFTLWYKAVCRCKALHKVLNKRLQNSPRIQFYYFSVLLRLLPKLPAVQTTSCGVFCLFWFFFSPQIYLDSISN